MLSVRLSEDMERRLDNLAKKSHRTKTYYAKKAIEEFIEDREDYLLAVSILEKNNPTITLEQLEKELGLEN